MRLSSYFNFLLMFKYYNNFILYSPIRLMITIQNKYFPECHNNISFIIHFWRWKFVCSNHLHLFWKEMNHGWILAHIPKSLNSRHSCGCIFIPKQVIIHTFYMTRITLGISLTQYWWWNKLHSTPQLIVRRFWKFCTLTPLHCVDCNNDSLKSSKYP